MTNRRKQTLAKLTRPRLYEALPRKRLFRVLDTARELPITWLAAPPGAGKTTLVASYLEARKLPTCWYQLDAGDTDAAAFFSYLIELAEQLKRPKNARLPYLTPEYLSDVAGFARRFFRSLFSWFPQQGVLVLDNCQEAATPIFHQIVAAAAEEVPTSARLIAISRTQSPTELARLKANGQLAELRWEELKLTPEESAGILQRKGIRDQSRAAEIHRAADGWAGGLMLLAADTGTAASARAINLNGKEAVFDYFAGQILDRAPRAEREILLKTALLPQVTPGAAVALSGDVNAPQVLDQLYRRQYFTDRRSEPELSYRYHDLFREFLLNRAQSELEQPAWVALHLHAAQLLLAGGDAERAIELLCRGGHVDEAQRAIIERAPALLGQGRWKTLLEAIALLPETQISTSASLLYWCGMAHIADDPAAARAGLEASLQLCQQTDDAIGQLSAIIGILAAHFVQDNSLAQYARWIDPMAALFGKIDRWPNPTIELEARSMFLLAASHQKPDHPLLPATAARVPQLLDETAIDPNTRTAAALRALVYFMWTGETQSAWRVNEHLETLFAAAEALPAHIAMGYAFRAYYQHLALGDTEQALRTFERAFAIAREHGLTHSESLAAQFQGIVSAAFGYDLDLAEAAVQRMLAIGVGGSLNRETNCSVVQALLHKWRGDVVEALRYARLAIAPARVNGAGFLLFVGSGVAHIYTDAGEYHEAQALVDELRALIRGGCFDNFGAVLLLEEAYIALRQQDHARCHERLRAGLRLARGEPRHLAVLHYVGGTIAALFGEALQVDIEADFVRNLIVRWKIPAPADAPADWPWPVSVQTLGQFAVKLDDKPIEFGRKAPRKTLALLKALIALGGTDVPEQTLTDALWPDEEGDAAHAAYTMTLSRLRKLLGDASLLQQRGAKLSLDRRKCWVDAWAFERSIGELDDYGAAGEALSSRLLSALKLYGGNFLPEDSDAPWAASMRERLRSRFVRAVSEAALALEHTGQHEQAAKLYQHGLDADNMAEAFYQGLMRCHAAAGRPTDAIAIYQRLRQLLSVTLSVKPSAASERLYQSLRGG